MLSVLRKSQPGAMSRHADNYGPPRINRDSRPYQNRPSKTLENEMKGGILDNLKLTKFVKNISRSHESHRLVFNPKYAKSHRINDALPKAGTRSLSADSLLDGYRESSLGPSYYDDRIYRADHDETRSSDKSTSSRKLQIHSHRNENSLRYRHSSEPRFTFEENIYESDRNMEINDRNYKTESRLDIKGYSKYPSEAVRAKTLKIPHPSDAYYEDENVNRSMKMRTLDKYVNSSDITQNMLKIRNPKRHDSFVDMKAESNRESWERRVGEVSTFQSEEFKEQRKYQSINFGTLKKSPAPSPPVPILSSSPKLKSLTYINNSPTPDPSYMSTVNTEASYSILPTMRPTETPFSPPTPPPLPTKLNGVDFNNPQTQLIGNRYSNHAEEFDRACSRASEFSFKKVGIEGVSYLSSDQDHLAITIAESNNPHSSNYIGISPNSERVTKLKEYPSTRATLAESQNRGSGNLINKILVSHRTTNGQEKHQYDAVHSDQVITISKLRNRSSTPERSKISSSREIAQIHEKKSSLYETHSNSSSIDKKTKPRATSVEGYRNMLTKVNNDRNMIQNTLPKNNYSGEKLYKNSELKQNLASKIEIKTTNIHNSGTLNSTAFASVDAPSVTKPNHMTEKRITSDIRKSDKGMTYSINFVKSDLNNGSTVNISNEKNKETASSILKPNLNHDISAKVLDCIDNFERQNLDRVHKSNRDEILSIYQKNKYYYDSEREADKDMEFYQSFALNAPQKMNVESKGPNDGVEHSDKSKDKISHNTKTMQNTKADGYTGYEESLATDYRNTIIYNKSLHVHQKQSLSDSKNVPPYYEDQQKNGHQAKLCSVNSDDIVNGKSPKQKIVGTNTIYRSPTIVEVRPPVAQLHSNIDGQNISYESNFAKKAVAINVKSSDMNNSNIKIVGNENINDENDIGKVAGATANNVFSTEKIVSSTDKTGSTTENTDISTDNAIHSTKKTIGSTESNISEGTIKINIKNNHSKLNSNILDTSAAHPDMLNTDNNAGNNSNSMKSSKSNSNSNSIKSITNTSNKSTANASNSSTMKKSIKSSNGSSNSTISTISSNTASSSEIGAINTVLINTVRVNDEIAGHLLHYNDCNNENNVIPCIDITDQHAKQQTRVELQVHHSKRHKKLAPRCLQDQKISSSCSKKRASFKDEKNIKYSDNIKLFSDNDLICKDKNRGWSKSKKVS